MKRSLAMPLTLLAAVTIASVGLFMSTRPPAQHHCVPSRGVTEIDVRELCGAPRAVYSTDDMASAFVQSEWDYGETVVGFVDGIVAYVLTLENGGR